MDDRSDELNNEMLLETEESEVASSDISLNKKNAQSNGALSELKERVDDGEALNEADLDLIADISVDILRSILACFGEEAANIDEYEGEAGELILDISGGDLAVLIGRHGRTLEALQQIITSLVNSRLGFHYPVIVDIEGYKDRRKQKLQSMAHNMAAKAKKQHKAQRMVAMNAYERRIIHLSLAEDAEVTTYSEGEDPERYVVIMPV